MFVYNYRIFDRYNRSVASLAVLADDDPNWRPNEFRQNLFGYETTVRFPIVKLLDLTASEAELETSDNPFATVVMAHLKALQTHNDSVGRSVWKLRLVRGLYERGFSAKDIRELFRVIDWLMELPSPLENLFWQDVASIQQENKMPFVSTPERVGRRAGMRLGIEALLKVRFGEEGLKLMPEIENVHYDDQLKAILEALGTAKTPDEVRRIWAAPMP